MGPIQSRENSLAYEHNDSRHNYNKAQIGKACGAGNNCRKQRDPFLPSQAVPYFTGKSANNSDGTKCTSAFN